MLSRRWRNLPKAQKYIDESVKPELKDAFTAYLEYVIQRNK